MFDAGLKGRVYEAERYNEHVRLDETIGIERNVDGALVSDNVPMRKAINELSRDTYLREIDAVIDRWNRMLAKMGIEFVFARPNKRFNRRIGAYKDFHFSPDGRRIAREAFEAGMKQKSTLAPIRNEANNGLKNKHYTLAMARTNDPHSATAQFFINTTDNDVLDFRAESPQGWGYAVFGRVVEGTEVVDAIEKARTGRKGFHDDVPLEDVVIVRVAEAG